MLCTPEMFSGLLQSGQRQIDGKSASVASPWMFGFYSAGQLALRRRQWDMNDLALDAIQCIFRKGCELVTAQCDVHDQLQHTQTHIYIHKCAHFNLHVQPAIYWPSHSSLPLRNKQEQHVGISLVMEVATMTTAATTTFIILACECQPISVVRLWPTEMGCERIKHFILSNSSEMIQTCVFLFPWTVPSLAWHSFPGCGLFSQPTYWHISCATNSELESQWLTMALVLSFFLFSSFFFMLTQHLQTSDTVKMFFFFSDSRWLPIIFPSALEPEGVWLRLWLPLRGKPLGMTARRRNGRGGRGICWELQHHTQKMKIR